MARETAPANDHRVFARTAGSTKRINIATGTHYRGGIRL